MGYSSRKGGVGDPNLGPQLCLSGRRLSFCDWLLRTRSRAGVDRRLVAVLLVQAQPATLWHRADHLLDVRYYDAGDRCRQGRIYGIFQFCNRC
jgi:hypothetical protein